MKIHAALFLTTVIFLNACAHKNAGIDTPIDVYANSPANQLAEAATAVSKSLLDIAEIQHASTPPPPNYHPPDFNSYGMGNLVSMNWAGPVEPIVNQIAKASGYQVKILGNQPAIPVMVYVSSRNQPLGDVLRNVGFQVNNKAHIIVFPNSKIIELRYLKSQA